MVQNRNIFAWILVILMMLASLCGCGKPQNTEEPPKEDEQKIDISIGALKGPTALGMLQMMDLAEKGETPDCYSFQIAGTADELTAGLIKGELQVAALPCNLASVLYRKTDGAVQIAAINTGCVLYIVENADTIHTVEDLKGRTIYSTGKGTTPEYTLNYLLRAAGLDPEKDVTIEYKSEAAEAAALLAEKEDAVAMLPQPYVTTAAMQNDRLRIALSVAEEWEKYTQDGSAVVTGVVLVSKSFAEEHPQQLQALLAQYEASTRYVNDNPAEAALLSEHFDIVKAKAAEKAIPYCNIMFVQGEEMKEKVSGYLNVLYKENPASVGGTLPDDGFYYFILPNS